MPAEGPTIDAIFSAAIELATPEERAAYLDHHCGDDSELKRRVEALLAAHFHAGDFLERPPVELPPLDNAIQEAPGMSVGPYKLLEQIGEGGMGVVFMAQQEEPVRRRVALKIIKPGMDSRKVIVRFEAERQALALMDHPNIARVLDAGTSATGKPYFVMELVKGIPIIQYCDGHRLNPRQRLELFTSVCQAVQHAHQKGVIHRDLKPTNVLVAEYDERPVPKIIDFGVAKAIDQPLTEKTMFTQFGQIVGTIEYMSPEQAKLNQLDIDTRSDIYSLGVLLYELLTGTTPLEHKRVKEVALLEMLRLVREEEPPKPSTRLSTTEGLPSIAANRSSEPKQLSGLVKGELDWIVMKALEKDRNRRYETANDLAADVHRYLQDEAVQACPPSAAYRLRKLARRNKAAIWTVGLIAIAMCVGTAVSTWQAFRATNAEALAQARLESESRSRAEADEARAEAERQSALAGREQNRAIDAERSTRRQLKAAQLNLASAAAFRGTLAETMAILENQRTDEGDASSRGFGWHYLWRLCHQGHQLTLRGNSGQVSSVRFAPDGKLLASGNLDGTVKLWDPKSGRLHATYANGAVAISSIAFSPDGTLIAAGCKDGTLNLWDLRTDKCTMSSHLHDQAVRGVAFSPDGKLIASTDAFDNSAHHSVGEIVISETAGGREVARYSEPGFSVAFSPDGSTLAVTQWFDGVKLIDVASGKVKQSLHLRLHVDDAAFSPDGKSVAAVGFTGEVIIWDVASGKMQSSPLGSSTAAARCIAYSADGTRLACGRDDGAVDLWDLATGRIRTQAHGDRIRSVAFSPDGKSLASGSDDGTVMLWDAEVRPDPGPVESHSGMIWSIRFSPDGNTLASTSDDKTVKLWNVATGQVSATLEGHTNPVICCAFSPDGQTLASGGDDRTVRLWDVATGQPRGVLQGHTLQVFAVAFSPDGKSLASGSLDDTVKIWDLATKAERATLTGHSSGVWSVAFSPDGKSLASAGSATGDVRLWDLNSKSLVRTIPDAYAFVHFSRDGKTLETRGSKDKSVVLWDLVEGAPRAILAKGLVDNITRNAACSADDSGLVVSREDGSLREVDMTTAQERVLLLGSDGPILTLAYSPDGNTVASGNRSGRVKFWRTASEHEVIEQGAGARSDSNTPTSRP